MSFTPSVVGSRSRMLPIALILLAATTLLHHVHNAEFRDEYPNMPGWLSATAVYGAWLVAALVGVAGYLFLRTGYRVTGTLLLVAYGCYGLDALPLCDRAGVRAFVRYASDDRAGSGGRRIFAWRHRKEALR